MRIPLGEVFVPTHIHADGGLYEVIDYPRMKPSSDSNWVNGVLYRNEENLLCVRSLENFNERFRKL